MYYATLVEQPVLPSVLRKSLKYVGIYVNEER
jgi:hypothetical protein